MSNLHKKFASDLAKEVAGITHDLGDGIKITVARLNNANHLAVVDRLRQPFKDRLDLGVPLSEEEVKKISARAIAEAVLIGWEGVEDENGNELPYSADQAEAILADPEMKDFYALVFQHAAAAANFRKYVEAVTEKNSGGTSDGQSSGETTSNT